MSTCNKCKFWRRITENCGRAAWIDSDGRIDIDTMAFYASAYDDSGLCAGIKTGPLFGCLNFFAKKVSKKGELK